MGFEQSLNGVNNINMHTIKKRNWLETNKVKS